MSADDFTELGSYVAGEIVEPWLYVFRDFDGQAIDLTSYEARVCYRLDGGTQVVRTATATTDGSDGSFEYAWVEADLATAGVLAGEMWVGNGGAHRPARSFSMTLREPLGGPPPDI